jgi:type IV secretion system protein VirD4
MSPIVRKAGAYVAAAIVAIAVVAIVVVEISGALGGLLAGNGAVLVGPLDAIGTAAALVDHFDAPRKAWPADVRRDLVASPELRPVLMFSFFLTLGAVVTPILMRDWVRKNRRLKRDAEGAEFADKGELDTLVVKKGGGGRVVLGTHHGKLIAAQANASTLIVAPAQSGKTSGLATPAILEWEGPLLATSVKGDLLVDTYEARRRVGEVRVFDPMGATNYEGSAWSPIQASDTWTAARRVSATLLNIEVPTDDGGPDMSFWRPSSQGYLAALLYAANLSDATIGDILSWIKGADIGDVDDALTALDNDGSRGAGRAHEEIEGLWGMDPKFVSSVRGTLSTALYAWGEESVEDATAITDGGITAEWLLNGNNTLYLVAPAQDQHRLTGLFGALIQTVVAEAFARSARTGKAIDPRLLMVLDEAANIAPIKNLDAIASTGPGQGVTVLTVLQNMSQADEAWGSDKAQTIVANHRARLFGSGIADTTTINYLQTMLGDRAARQASVTRDRGEIFSLGSRTESTDRRALLGAEEIRQIEENTALLIYGSLKPGRIELRPFYKDRRLSRLSAAKTPLPAEPAAAAAAAVPTTAATRATPAAKGAKLPPAPALPVSGVLAAAGKAPAPAAEPEEVADVADVEEIDVDELNPDDLGASAAATAPYDLYDGPEPDEDDDDGLEPPEDALEEFEALGDQDDDEPAEDAQRGVSGDENAKEPATPTEG